jgi:hemerythrin
MAVNYPEYPHHKQTHDLLLSKVNNILLKCSNHLAKPAFTQVKPEIILEITHFLNEWLAHHIKGEDQRMMQFLQL